MCCILAREFNRRGYELVFVYGRPSVLGKPSAGCEGKGNFQLPSQGRKKEDAQFFLNIVRSQSVDVVLDVSVHSQYHDMAYAVQKERDYILISTYHGDPYAVVKELRDKYDYLSIFEQGLSRLFKQAFFLLKYPLSRMLRKVALEQRFRKMTAESDCLVLLCEPYARQVRKMVGRSLAEKVSAVKNPCDTGGVMPMSFESKKNQVLFVGRMVFQKRVDRMLRIWSKIESRFADWELVLIGEGEDKNLFQTYAETLRLKRARFVGAQRSTEYMAGAKLLAQCSTHEGFGMVLLEGMHYGTVPVLFNSFLAAEEIVNDGVNGYLVKPFNERCFANRLAKLMGDEALLASLQRYAIDSTSRFDVQTIVDDWEELFQKKEQ